MVIVAWTCKAFIFESSFKLTYTVVGLGFRKLLAFDGVLSKPLSLCSRQPVLLNRMPASPRRTLCRHGATDFYPSSDIQRNPFTSGLGCVIEEDQRIYSPAAVAAQALGCRIKKQ